MKKILRYISAALIACITGAAVLGCSLYRNIGDLPDESRFTHLPYYKNGEFISPRSLGYYPEKATGEKVWFGESENFPKRPLPMQPLTKADFNATSEFAYYWLGHSSAIMELGGQRILIDPVFFNAAPIEWSFAVKRFQDAPLAREELPQIDIVLITHDHYDHLEASTMRYLKDKGVKFITPLGVGARLTS